ncbi:MAG TPA: hypothetical protein VN894_14475, partial [Polyangiaceae bacterium]|nr:hypothetical protein [Polyangiaceae bacterium]
MSLFSKSPKDGPQKPDLSGTKAPAQPPPRGVGQRAPSPPQAPQAAPVYPPPAAPPKPAPPAIVPTRIIDGAAARARPAMPAIAIGPPAAPP